MRDLSRLLRFTNHAAQGWRQTTSPRVSSYIMLLESPPPCRTHDPTFCMIFKTKLAYCRAFAARLYSHLFEISENEEGPRCLSANAPGRTATVHGVNPGS